MNFLLRGKTVRNKKSALRVLDKYSACEEAQEWVGERTVEEAWVECPRGDWMLWIYAKMYPTNIKEITLAKGHCANTVRHLLRDERSIQAIDIAIAFGEGRDISLKQLNEAAAYAGAYASAAYAAAAAAAYGSSTTYASAAYASAYAASVNVAICASDADYDAASAASSAASYAASAATDTHADDYAKNQMQTASICREILNLPLFKS